MKEKSGKNESALGGRRRERASLSRLTNRQYSYAVRVRSRTEKSV